MISRVLPIDSISTGLTARDLLDHMTERHRTGGLCPNLLGWPPEPELSFIGWVLGQRLSQRSLDRMDQILSEWRRDRGLAVGVER